MTYIMVDVEADGPIPDDYAMVCFGAIVASHRWTEDSRNVMRHEEDLPCGSG